jgi:hypothetical protein
VGKKAAHGLLADQRVDDAIRPNHQQCLGVLPEGEQIPGAVKSETCGADEKWTWVTEFSLWLDKL